MNKFDFEGYEVLTIALQELLNRYPGLEGGKIAFCVLNDDKGKAMFPQGGSVIINEIEDVTGYVEQDCAYPFYIVYRTAGASENRKAQIKEWLDNLGRWLEKQPVKIKGEEYKLNSYPVLSDDRKFTQISRQSPAFLSGTNEDKVEDWVISIQAKYKKWFEREE